MRKNIEDMNENGKGGWGNADEDENGNENGKGGKTRLMRMDSGETGE